MKIKGILTAIILIGLSVSAFAQDEVTENAKVTDIHPVENNSQFNGFFKQASTLGLTPMLKIGGEEFADSERNFIPSLRLNYAGDLNGDGYDDFYYTVVAADETTPNLDDEVTKTIILYGTPNGIDTQSSVLVRDGYSFVADLTGDGQPESIQYIDGTLYIVVDESNGTMETLTDIDLITLNYGLDYSMHGDVNGDGNEDLLVYGGLVSSGTVIENYLIYGASDLSGISVDTLSYSPGVGSSFSEYYKMAYSDINNDGTTEFVQVLSGADISGNTFGAVNIYNLNESGELDIISSDTLNGYFQYNSSMNAGRIGLADMNNDQNEELLLYSGGMLDIFEISSDTVLTFDSDNPVASYEVNGFSILNDFDGNGTKELIIYNQDFVRYLTMDVDFNVTETDLPMQEGDFVYSPINYTENVNGSGDVNGDGIDDIVVGFTNSTEDRSGYRVHFGNSTGILTDTVDTHIQSSEVKNVRYVSNVGDVNADGILDYAISYGQTDVHLFYGGPFSSSTEADVVFEYDSRTFAPRHGDFNGDGISDMIVTESARYSPDTTSARFYVYFGGSSMDSIPDHIVDAADVFPDSIEIGSMGNVNSIGDINNDGYDDIAFISEQEPLNASDPNTGTTKILFGGTSMSSTPDLELPFFSSEFLSVGDFNEDGIDDFAINFLMDNIINIHIGFDAASGQSLDPEPYLTLTVPEYGVDDNMIQTSFFGFTMTSGDFNGDGVKDLAASTLGSVNAASPSGNYYEGGPALYIFEGGADADSIADAEIYLLSEYFGNPSRNSNDVDTLNQTLGSIASVPDQNNDGADELLFTGTLGYTLNAGVFFGGELDTMGTNLGIFMEGPNPEISLGAYNGYFYASNGYPAVGDFDGDNKNDYLLPQSNDRNFIVDPVYVFSSDQFSVSNEEELSSATEFELFQNYPNPFNPTTKISYRLPVSGKVKLEVYDITGRLVSTILDEQMTAGTYTQNFDASALASGVYIYRLKAADFTQVKKMMLIK